MVNGPQAWQSREVATDDPVSQRLADAGPSATETRSASQSSHDIDADSQTVMQQRHFEWLDRQQRRKEIRRDATRCATMAWGLMTTIATLGSLVAFVFHRNLTQAFPSTDDRVFDPSVSLTIQTVPYLLAITAALLFVLGGLAIASGRFPGQRSTLLGVDWATACDAVSQFLSTQSTYSDSLRGAAVLFASKRFGIPFQSSRTVASWLESAAIRIDSGRKLFEPNSTESGDQEKLRLLVHSMSQDSNQNDASGADFNPSHRWNEASEYFMTVSQQRLEVLTYSLPSIATVLSGILLWVSISASLGWMWQSVAAMLKNLGAGL